MTRWHLAALPMLLLFAGGCELRRADGPVTGSEGARAEIAAARSDVNDTCRYQLELFLDAVGVLDRIGAPRSRVALARTLGGENAALSQMQGTFERLLQCRSIEAQRLRTDLADGRLSRRQAGLRMEALRSRMRRDLVIANQVTTRVSARSEELNRAAGEVLAGRRLPSFTQFASAPEAAAGRAPPAPAPNPATGRGSNEDLRTLAATNIAYRDNFQQTLAQAEESLPSTFELPGLFSGFELGS